MTILSHRLVARFGGLVAAAILVAGLVGAPPARAVTSEQELVATAKFAAEDILTNPETAPYVKSLMKRAKGVLIIPEMYKGAFIFGAEGGNGVLLAKADNGQWSYPGFFSIGSASFGLQAGASASKMMIIIMNNRALSAVLDRRVKLGADLNAAVGPHGVGAEASTTSNLGEDMYVYSLSSGAYLGASVEGAWIQPRNTRNASYYDDQNVTPKGVVLEGRYQNPDANPLRALLEQYSQAN